LLRQTTPIFLEHPQGFLKRKTILQAKS
jgi:hypothetical protein